MCIPVDRRVDLDDGAAGLADRCRDVGADEVDAGDVEPDHPGGLLGDLDVVRVGVEGPVDGDAAGRRSAGQRQLHHLTDRWDRVERVTLAGQHLLGGGVDLILVSTFS